MFFPLIISMLLIASARIIFIENGCNSDITWTHDDFYPSLIEPGESACVEVTNDSGGRAVLGGTVAAFYVDDRWLDIYEVSMEDTSDVGVMIQPSLPSCPAVDCSTYACSTMDDDGPLQTCPSPLHYMVTFCHR